MRVLVNWDAVDTALRNIQIKQMEVKALQNNLESKIIPLQKKIDAIAEKSAAKTGPLYEQIADLETQIEKFARDHRGDFDGATMKLNNGSLKLAQGKPGTRLIKDAAEVLKLVKERFKRRYIRVSEALKKDAILTDRASGKLSDDDLKNCGIEIYQDLNFSYKLNGSV